MATALKSKHPGRKLTRAAAAAQANALAAALPTVAGLAQPARSFGVDADPPAGPTVDVRAFRRRLGLRQEELARVLGCSTRSVAGWEAGSPVTGAARLKVLEVDRLARALAQIMPEDRVGGWMRAPNAAFDGQTPIQLVERGASDLLWRMIHQIDANVAG
jgi:transcriptional regulator with XRE-family HTH domain